MLHSSGYSERMARSLEGGSTIRLVGSTTRSAPGLSSTPLVSSRTRSGAWTIPNPRSWCGSPKEPTWCSPRKTCRSRSPLSSLLDGRSLFLAKHEGCFLYGTSDDWEEADPGAPIPSVRDIEYLLSTLDRFMPEAGLDGQKARFVYSGFRPLLCPGNGDLDSAAASREDHIEVSPSGLISVIGGKLTTARIIAIRVLDRVIERIGGSTTWSKCRTHRLSIGGTNEAVAEGLAYWVKRYPRLAWYFQILYQRYGLDAHTICREAMAIHKGLVLTRARSPFGPRSGTSAAMRWCARSRTCSNGAPVSYTGARSSGSNARDMELG